MLYLKEFNEFNKIKINDISYPFIKPKSNEQGMIGKKDLNGIMLFEFDNPKNAEFHMRGCLIPLDIIFVNEKGIITDIYENCQPDTNGYNSSEPCKWVIESKPKTIKCKKGDKINL